MLIKVYTNIEGKLAQWDVVADDAATAIAMVRKDMRLPKTKRILASMYVGPVQMDLF